MSRVQMTYRVPPQVLRPAIPPGVFKWVIWYDNLPSDNSKYAGSLNDPTHPALRLHSLFFL